jgi:hypothetical protein
MKVAVMQPYLFPYLGYFQLVNAVDVFVFADDVNFIKRGFINRNKILLNKEEYYFTVPCLKLSQNKLINEIRISTENKGYPENILLTYKQAYKKAPFFKQVFPIIQSIFNNGYTSISELASNSVIIISKYLEIETTFKYSSIDFGHTRGQEKSARLINITKELGSDHYINPIGGTTLYEKEHFKSNGVTLEFLSPGITAYKQFDNEFVPKLSIIDVLMFNSPEKAKIHLEQYKLV